MIRKANNYDIDLVKSIVVKTIQEVYPHYYPKGAVEFFINHHNEVNIVKDIELGNVFILEIDNKQIGTITVKGNEVNRLFVLPCYQGKGYGKYLLEFAEELMYKNYNEIRLDSSLPAKLIYLKRGYKEIESHNIRTENGDYLCYDVMVKEAINVRV